MDNRKILLFVAILLIVVGVGICIFAAVTNSFDCDCTKSSDDCKVVEKEEKELFQGSIIDMELDIAHSVSFDYDVSESFDTSFDDLELEIKGRYLFVIDEETIWLDDFNGYAKYHNDIIILDDYTLKILSQVFESYEEEECCSCCPDLQPGESCIELCCPCGD